MSLSADIADAIIRADAALDRVEQEVNDGINPSLTELRDAVEDLMETSLGEGMHFNSLAEARAFRQPVAPEGYHLCADCDTPIPNGRGFGRRCGDCMDPHGSA